MTTTQAIAEYLVDHGMDDSEVDHLMKVKIFGGKSILDYIREGQTETAWQYAIAWIQGDSWQ